MIRINKYMVLRGAIVMIINKYMGADGVDGDQDK